jgi:hypothetical protein
MPSLNDFLWQLPRFELNPVRVAFLQLREEPAEVLLALLGLRRMVEANGIFLRTLKGAASVSLFCQILSLSFCWVARTVGIWQALRRLGLSFSRTGWEGSTQWSIIIGIGISRSIDRHLKSVQRRAPFRTWRQTGFVGRFVPSVILKTSTSLTLKCSESVKNVLLNGSPPNSVSLV